MKYRYTLFIFFLVLVLGACASTGELSTEESPVAGDWTYSIDSPQGIYTGTLMIVQGDSLEVSLAEEGQEDNPEEIISAYSVEFDEETQTLSFSFDNPEFGTMHVSLVLGEEGLSGGIHVVQFGVDLPLMATRSDQ
ncbi:MAG: hypothetical protein F4065_05010 [Rhodothermaceae bacterium]|nr:hypothetical protein [Rhodothermaceae bacterium]MXZ58005.1 hypothetical protein [Rhodothermaceae bacterium]MYB91523.1 hypothetical protein [Rhodothermaceae bacterium]MYD69068.1 hypothetical protein [Rhodothermaceae bacterium]MYG43634.1 hypothetical protein [Rhodothermaceae bacterium]